MAIKHFEFLLHDHVRKHDKAIFLFFFFLLLSIILIIIILLLLLSFINLWLFQGIAMLQESKMTDAAIFGRKEVLVGHLIKGYFINIGFQHIS